MPSKFFLATILCCGVHAALAQQGSVPTIPGPFQNELSDRNKRYMTVSADGELVAFYADGKHTTFNASSGTFKRAERQFGSGGRSEDLQLEYFNGTGHFDSEFDAKKKRWPGPAPLGWRENGFAIYKIGDPKPLRFQRGGAYLHCITGNRQLLLSQYEEDSNRRNGSLQANIGLWLADFNGVKIRQLRSDTIRRAYFNEHTRDDNAPYFNPNKTGLIRVLANRTQQFLPFGSDSIIVMEGLSRHPVWDPVYPDDHYLYVPDEKTSDLHVWSLRTGKKLFTKERKTSVANPSYFYRRCMYAEAPGEGVYTLDLEAGKVYQEVATGSDMRVIKEWSVDKSTFPLDPGQDYRFTVCKGPAMLIVPRMRELGDNPKNIGYFVDLTTGKTKLRIAPFFTTSATELAAEAAASKKVAEANAAHAAKREAEKAATEAKRIADCEAEYKAKGLYVGATVTDGRQDGILKRYDCKTNKAYVALPYYVNSQEKPKDEEISGDYFRAIWTRPNFTLVTCPLCNGKGYQEFSETKTNTHELPHGYFSGIRTTKTTTWTEKSARTCKGCGGLGQAKKQN